MFSGFLGDMQEDYIVGAASEYCEVFYTFGVDGLGKEDYNEYEPDYKRGFPTWSDGFDLYDAAGRGAMLDFCAAARAAPCGADECALGLLHLPGSVTCFYEEFEAWKAAGLGTPGVARSCSVGYAGIVLRETTAAAGRLIVTSSGESTVYSGIGGSVSVSVWPSAVPSSVNPGDFSSTNRCRTSTPSSGSRCAPRCASCIVS